MAWFVPAMLAGLKAAGIGAATTLGSNLVGNMFQQPQQPNLLPMSNAGMSSNMLSNGIGNNNNLFGNFVGGFLNNLNQNRQKPYPQSGMNLNIPDVNITEEKPQDLLYRKPININWR